MLSFLQGFTFIFGKISSLANALGVMSPHIEENLAHLANIGQENTMEVDDALISDAIGQANQAEEIDDHIMFDITPYDARVGLRGLPIAVPPVIRFMQRDCLWRVIRGKPPDMKRAPLKTIGKFSMNCVVCKNSLSSQPNPLYHSTMKAWASIDLPCCELCSRIAHDSSKLIPGTCFCCFGEKATTTVQRKDNGVCFLLCNGCSESSWMRILESVGIDLIRTTGLAMRNKAGLIAGSMIDSNLDLFDKHVIRIRDEDTKNLLPEPKIANNELLVEPEVAVDVSLYENIECDRDQCIECAQKNATLVRCSSDELCQSRICVNCIANRYGSLWRVYASANAWNCEKH